MSNVTRCCGLLLVILLLTACGASGPQSANGMRDGESDVIPGGGEAFNGYRYDNLDDLMAGSDTVVLGTVREAEQYGGRDEYKFNVEALYKGETVDTTIHIFESRGTLRTGRSYILFLSATEGFITRILSIHRS